MPRIHPVAAPLRPAALGALVCAALLPATALGHGRGPLPPTAVMSPAGAMAPCPGEPIRGDRVVTGTFTPEQMGSYVLVPFDVPEGTTSVRVKYCFDQPESPASAQVRHTLDLGLYDARPAPGALWGEREFRGWGGSSHPDVTISREGFSSEAEYTAAPRKPVPGKTTRGYLPGPIPAGEWAAELGVANVVPQSQGDTDGQVAWRVEVELSADPAHADEPYVPAPYDDAPASREAGWYAGDLHVHAEHSALGDATMRETLDYAFGPAKLDFLTLSDYVTSSAWGEIGRVQPFYPGKLVARSAEVITYRGHLNNHVSRRYVDYRTGPVLERLADGALVQRRAARPPRELFALVREAGGFTQVNHPTIFPSDVPLFRSVCRGCPWDYSDEETGWPLVDAYEVHTGPPGNDAGPNPFTLTAIDELDRLRRAGHWVAAVAVSDSHNAGRTPSPVTQAPVGTGTTVVYAPELSEEGIRYGVQHGHTYAKVFGAASPDLRLEARAPGGAEAIMGDGLPGDRATLVARVIGGSSRHTLLVLRDGRQIASVPVGGADFRHELQVSGRGDYRIQVMRGSAVEALTTPIRLGAEHPPVRDPHGVPLRPSLRPGTARRLVVRARPRSVRAGRRSRVRFVVTAGGLRVRGAKVWLAGARARTGRRGRATIRKTFVRPGRRRALVTKRGFRSARVTIRVLRARR
ncbi:MAG TPA: CehA/McbA family metallohydrolase [Solirubrobacteraceae bacterium]|nr:CehA/McbA family metallohydrolase [Solirubrobacteraceae bacterium]